MLRGLVPTTRAAHAARDSANAVIRIERGWALILKEVDTGTHYERFVTNQGNTSIRIASVTWNFFAMGISDNLPASS
jgi:hypothetical protein